MLDQIGLLDDDFFFSMEDVDIAWRAQLGGWRCLYTPDAIVYHHLAATGGDVTASYYDGRNTIYVLVKNYPTQLWRKYRWLMLRSQLHQGYVALRNWRGRAARARLRGMLAGLRGAPRMMRKRRRIQAMRTVSVQYLEEILSSPECWSDGR
jgi:GT2 family glycosyltransferase